MMEYLCEMCRGTQSTIIKRLENYNVRGESIDIEANVQICESCGNELFDEKLETDNLIKAYNIYRQKHGIMKPEEIREIRQRYGLSQRALSKILGWGEITVHRYETGAIPDSSHNTMLRLIENPIVMKELLLEAREAITQSTYKKTMARVDALIEEREDEEFLNMIEHRVQSSSINIESGFKRFDIEKFLQVVLFFAEEVPTLWKTKLNKLLFYSDFTYFKHYTTSLTGLKYLKYEFGPVPDNYEGLLWSMEKLGLIDLVPSSAGLCSGTIIRPLTSCNKDVFGKEEIEVLLEVKNLYGSTTSGEISDISHKEKAWLETQLKDIISYEHSMNLN